MSSRFAPPPLESVVSAPRMAGDAFGVVDVGGDDAGQRRPRQRRRPGPRGQRVRDLGVAQAHQRARNAVRVRHRHEPVRLAEPVVLGPAPEQAREVDGLDRPARLAFDQLLAVEEIQQARHVPRIGAGQRRQLAHAEGQSAVGQRAHQAAGLGRVQRPRRPRHRPRAALVAARRDEHGRAGRGRSRMLPAQVDVADPLLRQALARARAQERRDDDEGVGGGGPQRAGDLADQARIQLAAGADGQRGAGPGRRPDGQPGVGDVVGFRRDVRRPVPGKDSAEFARPHGG